MLTDSLCKNATCPPHSLRLRLSDAGGLYLEVTPNGSKRWFWKYRFGGKEKRLALGAYCEQRRGLHVSLKQARIDRDKARLLLASGVDPAQRRQLDKLERQAQQQITFEAVAREFHGTKITSLSPHYAGHWLGRMEREAFPWIGSLPLAEITAPLLLQVLRRMEARGLLESAQKLRQGLGQVFRYGVATGRCERNPMADLHGALKAVQVKHMAAVLEPEAAGALLRAIHSYKGQPETRIALALAALLFQRPGNIRAMEWQEISFEKALWSIPASKMKGTVHAKRNGRPHLVPLAPQALDLLREIQPLTGGGRYVFPCTLTGERPMSENTLRAALRRMGYSNDEMTAHGFRAMARTIMVEQLDVMPDVIEAQLAHSKSGPLGSAYDRAEFMEKRRRMMNEWASYLERIGSREGCCTAT